MQCCMKECGTMLVVAALCCHRRGRLAHTCRPEAATVGRGVVPFWVTQGCCMTSCRLIRSSGCFIKICTPPCTCQMLLLQLFQALIPIYNNGNVGQLSRNCCLLCQCIHPLVQCRQPDIMQTGCMWYTPGSCRAEGLDTLVL